MTGELRISFMLVRVPKTENTDGAERGLQAAATGAGPKWFQRTVASATVCGVNAALRVCLGLLLAAAGVVPAAEPTPVRVTVTDTVLRPKVPRIGFNVCQNPMDDRSTLLQNCLNVNPGLESGVLARRLFIASAGDARTFEEPAGGDAEYQKAVPESFWVGAEFHVLDGKAAGRKGRIAACAYGGRAKTVFTAEGDGPAFAAGDLIWLNQPRGKGRLNAGWGSGTDYSAHVAEDEQGPFHGGQTCLKLDAQTFKRDAWNMLHLWLPSFKRWGGGRSANREGNADRFMQEKTYRISFWAKGTPGGKGSVRFVASSEPGQAEPDDFTLTDTWHKHELIRKSRPMVNLLLVLSRGEQMYVDGFVISEDDGGEPLAILPRVADALADLKPGTLRLLGGARGESLDNWLAHPLERLRTVERSMTSSSGGPYRDPDQPNLPDSLNLCERAGASPWLVMGLAMTDEEWDHLLEYLAGPADSPYGAKRARHGQPESWLKTFDTVYLELGDEVWNKGKSPWNLDDAARYAAWAERVFSRVRASKYYSGKIRLVAGGNARDPKWNEAVLKGCQSLDVLSCPATIGGADAFGGKHVATATMQARLLAWPAAETRPQLAAAAQLAKGAGKSFALGGCEVVSREQSFLGPERSLLRSQTAAVAVLDELLLALAGGSEAVQFSRFAQGSDNATHVDAHKLALHPSALAIRLFNLHAGGMDLVSCSITLAPPDSLAPGVPALVAYAFKGQGRSSVLLLNRSPATAYQAALAWSAGSGKVRGYRIAAENPLANNLNEIQVKTEEFDADPASGIAVPAHSIVLVETKEERK